MQFNNGGIYISFILIKTLEKLNWIEFFNLKK